MHQPSAFPADTMGTKASPAAETRLHGRWLVLAQVMWVSVVVCTLTFFAISLPAYYARLQISCVGVAACQLNGALTSAGIRAIQATGLSLSTYATYTITLNLIVVLIWSAVGLIIFWRRSDDWLALLVAAALILFNAGQQDGATTALAFTYPAWTVPVEMINFLSQAPFGLFLFLFPDGRFAPRWMRWFVVFYLVQTLLTVFPSADYSPFVATSWLVVLNVLIFVSVIGVGIFSQIYRYVKLSNPQQRQQVKWAVFGMVISAVLIIGLNVSVGFFGLNPLYEAIINTLFPAALLPIPLSIGIAILRYRLWDIDTIINRTLVYGALTVSLALGYAGLVISFQALLGTIIKQNNDVAIVISTLAIFVLFQPLRSRIQQVIDRRFYRRKYDAARVLKAFGATLHNEVDLEHLTEHLLAMIQEAMQPASVSLWLVKPQKRVLAPSPQTSSLHGTDHS